MIKHADSHLDHALTKAQVSYLMKMFADRVAFFIETIDLPPELGTVPCGLYGPTMGDAAIADSEVTLVPRSPRTWDSRLVARPVRQVRQVTVIAGPHEEKCPYCCGDGLVTTVTGSESDCPKCNLGTRLLSCVLYTAFGGPSAPQEPGDPGCKDPEASAAFWRVHALAR